MPAANTVPIRIYADTRRATQHVRQFNKILGETGRKAKETQKGTRGAATEVERFGLAAQKAWKAAGALGGAIGAIGFVRLAIDTGEAADKVALLEQRLTTLSGQAGGFEVLFEMSQRLGQGLDATADVFARFTLGTRDLGLTRTEVAQLTESVFQLGRIGGSASQEIANASLQLGQALASGRLQGDELRSVLENLPLVGIQIADSLGVSVGALRDLGAEGVLTAEVVTGALLGGVEDVREQFEKLPRTMAQARAELGNSWTNMLAAFGAELATSDIYTFFTQTLGDAFDFIARRTRGPRGEKELRAEFEAATKALESAETQLAKIRAEGEDASDSELENRRQLIRTLEQERRHAEGYLTDLRGQLNIIEDQAAAAERLKASQRTNRTFGTREPVPYREPLKVVDPPSAQQRETDAYEQGLMRRAELLENQLLSERQLVEQAYAERMQLAQDLAGAGFEQQARDAELAAITLHQEEITAIEKAERDKRQAQAEQDAQEEANRELQRRQAISQASRGFAALAQEMGGRQRTLAKAAAVADATVHTYMAANRALSSGVPPWNYVAAAGVVAAGLANVARIRSQPVPRASGGDVTAGEAYRVAEMSPEVFRDSSGKSYLIPQGSGRVEPLGATAGASPVQVIMQNRGTNARIGSAQMLSPGQLEIVLEMAEQNVRAGFAEDLEQGHGSFAHSLQAHTNTRRIVR